MHIVIGLVLLCLLGFSAYRGHKRGELDNIFRDSIEYSDNRITEDLNEPIRNRYNWDDKYEDIA